MNYFDSLGGGGGGDGRISLYDKLISTSYWARSRKRAHLFALILYSVKDAHMVKVFKDIEYIDALNEISNKYLSVLVFPNSNKVYSLSEPRDIYNISTPGQREIEEARKIFGLDIHSNNPVIIFFQVNDQRQISDSVTVKINGSEPAEIFNNIRHYFTELTNTLKGMKEYGQTDVVFDLAEITLKSIRLKEMANARITRIANYVDWFLRLKGIFSIS